MQLRLFLLQLQKLRKHSRRIYIIRKFHPVGKNRLQHWFCSHLTASQPLARFRVQKSRRRTDHARRCLAHCLILIA